MDVIQCYEKYTGSHDAFSSGVKSSKSKGSELKPQSPNSKLESLLLRI
jgi:hypothetical protein